MHCQTGETECFAKLFHTCLSTSEPQKGRAKGVAVLGFFPSRYMVMISICCLKGSISSKMVTGLGRTKAAQFVRGGLPHSFSTAAFTVFQFYRDKIIGPFAVFL